MEIYQVHEYGGEWEDRFDRIIKSTLKIEKAVEYKQKYESEFSNKLQVSRLCYDCPLGEENGLTLERLSNYCPRVTIDNLKINGNEIVDCDKYEFVYEENTKYRIEEVDVEE